VHLRRGLGLWGAVALLVVGYGASATPAWAQAPNVLIVVTDDQRASDTLSVMPQTRRLFAANGRRYPNAFAATPLCCPSRATILTGRYAHNTRVRTNGEARRLDPETIFLRLLREDGYQTALAGKFLNSWPGTTAPPHFDRYAMVLGRAPYTNPRINLNGSIARHRGYSTTLIRRYARRFLRRFERRDDRPWLLYAAPNAPHPPSRAEPKYADAHVSRWRGNPSVFERDRADKPRFVRRLDYTFEEGRAVRARQLRTLMSVDDMVARIFDSLGALRERRDTLAIFLSDNGFVWADHGLGGESGTAGQKRLPYTASIKIPLMIRWPGHIAEDSTDRRLTGTVDIAPTVLEAAGVAPDPAQPPLDGHSLLQSAARDRALLEYWNLGNGPFPTWASTRTRAFQYIEYYAEDGRTRTFREYYDLRRDPWQLTNLLRDGDPSNNPSLAGLHAQLAADRDCVGTQGARACP
jgi:arylsulfatase A-like enzyme